MRFQHIHDLAELETREPTTLAVGSFDGVHRGHQQLLKSMVEEAKKEGTRPGVLTFFPHPRLVIQGITNRYYLTPPTTRATLLQELGIELIITHPFNDTIRQMRAIDFINHLQTHLELRHLWGGNFSLGHNREGNATFLRQVGQEQGFTVHELDSLTFHHNERVSSTRIRRSLQAGNLTDANTCLTRPFRISGEVVLGDQRGQTIGFPTANLKVWEQQLLPNNGVYATYAWVNGQRFPAATNVGTRPTVDGTHLSVEAHLLGFDDNIYGQTIALDFIARIRPEQKFSGLDPLITQIQKDVAQVQAMLSPPI